MSTEVGKTIDFASSHREFSSLEDVLSALFTNRCYSACDALRYKKSECMAEREKIVKQLISATQYELQQILAHYAERWNNSDIQTLNATLQVYKMRSEEKVALRKILLDGLEAFIQHFPDQASLHRKIADIVYDSGYGLPPQYAYLLRQWRKLKYDWQQQGMDRQAVWLKLIDVDMLKTHVRLEQEAYEDFDDDLLRALHESDNLVVLFKRGSLWEMFEEVVEGFFKEKIRWLSREEVVTIPSDAWIELNEVTALVDQYEDFYFEYLKHYYHFIIYSAKYRETNFLAMINIFNRFLQLFKPIHAVHEFYNEDGANIAIYFTADQKKFDILNQKLELPCTAIH
jgi:hypothetical protein